MPFVGVVVTVTMLLIRGATAEAAGQAEVLLARTPAELIPHQQTAQRPLAKGMRLSPGDGVRTGRDGAAELELGDGSLVRLGELSDFEVDRLETDGSGARRTTRLNLATGRFRAWAARQLLSTAATGQRGFAVETPVAVAAVRQTDFVVVHAPGVGTRVYTLSGSVEITSKATGRSVVCGPGEWTEVVGGGSPTPCRPITAAELRALERELPFESQRAQACGPGALVKGYGGPGKWSFGPMTVTLDDQASWEVQYEPGKERLVVKTLAGHGRIVTSARQLILLESVAGVLESELSSGRVIQVRPEHSEIVGYAVGDDPGQIVIRPGLCAAVTILDSPATRLLGVVTPFGGEFHGDSALRPTDPRPEGGTAQPVSPIQLQRFDLRF